ncbi:hypothetical protein [Sinisalibacter aestuarii]|uniref:Flagellar protein FlgN n=1 Tax=Sinisalibacter aestuarii TaxID=2949426 RepID=A0ABQ5LNX3_9RHOB|nr:hypothetical protein [Sinisalibacter aestuarii]GKY86700.1 hypothetical protein STA1M1_05690 [Sinisalibacter aestuarii]
MLFDRPGAADALEDLLDRERALLIEGRIAQLDRATRHKAQLIARLAGAADTAQLTRIRAKAERNQRLLQGAVRGIEAARQRLAHIGEPPVRLSTYSADGARRDLGQTHAADGINHRA